MMRIVVADDYRDLSRQAADLAVAMTRDHPSASMVVAWWARCCWHWRRPALW
jgi:hypothetical protein